MNPTWLYVGAVYAVAVWLARRGGNPLPKRIALLFLALVVIFFFKAMTGHYVSIAMDIPRLIAPWSASAPGLTKYTVLNMETHDVPMQLVPWAHQVRQAWLSGHVPLWNALAGCGYPLLANAQSAAFSPLRLLSMPLPLAYAMTAEAAMKILVALTFTFLYCRRRNGALPSTIAAIAYGFGPFVVAWLHFAQSTVACFLPAVLYQIDLLAERRSYPRFVTTAVIGAMTVFCGHPETAVHILLFAAAYVLWIVLVERKRDFLPALAGAGAVAFLLALPLIVPFAENVRQSTRFEEKKASGSAMPFSDEPSLALLVQPRLYGTRPGNPWGPATAEAVTGFAGILGIAALIAIAIDAVLRRRFREREVFFVLAVITVFALLANVGPAVAALHAVIGLAANARLRFLLAWLLAVLIAAALDRLSRGNVLPFAIGLASAAALLVLIIVRTPFPSDTARHDGLLSVIPSLIVIAVAAIALVPRLRSAASLMLVVAVIAEMWPLTIGWNRAFPMSTFYPRTPLIDAVLRHHRPGFDRVAGIGGVLFPNTNAMFGIEDARIHDPMEPAPYVHFIGNAITHDYYKKWIDESTPLLDRLNVRWLMTEPGHELTDTTRYALRYAGPDGRLYENLHAMPRFFGDGADVRITAACGDAYTLEVDADMRTTISSSVGSSRWWRITISQSRALLPPHFLRGEKVPKADEGGAPRADVPFLTFIVPAGHTTIRIRYVPVSFYAASLLALLTAAVLVCFMIRAGVQRHMDLRRRALRDRDRLRTALEPGGP
ncbi:MAG TPA: YfhO family protein [Thermoanaerobaculia bacterium]